MDIYSDYANWRCENDELIKMLTKESIICERFDHIFLTISFLYEKYLKNSHLDEEEESIFTFGFNYLYDEIVNINLIKESYYENIKDMYQDEKAIALLLYAYDIQNEIDDEEEKRKLLNDFIQKTISYLEKHEMIPDEMYGLFSDLMYQFFPKDDYQGVPEIFYDIALELDIIK